MALNAETLQERGNLRAATVHHDETSALTDKAGHILCKGPAEFRHGHGMSAVFDYHRR